MESASPPRDEIKRPSASQHCCLGAHCPGLTESMVVRVGGSFAYLSGDGILTFEDHVRTVGELRKAIEEATNIAGVKQRIFTSGGRLCDDDSALLEAHKENPDGGHKMFMIVDEHVEERKASEARRREKKGEADHGSSLASHPDAPRREGCTVN